MIDALALVPIWAWMMILVISLPTRWVFEVGYVQMRFPNRRELGWSVLKSVVGVSIACTTVGMGVCPTVLGCCLLFLGMTNLFLVMMSGGFIPPFEQCRGVRRLIGPALLLAFLTGSVPAPLWFGYRHQSARVSEIRTWRETSPDGKETVYLFELEFSPIVDTGSIVGWTVSDSANRKREFRVQSGLGGLRLREEHEKGRRDDRGAMVRVEFTPNSESGSSVVAATVLPVPWWH